MIQKQNIFEFICKLLYIFQRQLQKKKAEAEKWKNVPEWKRKLMEEKEKAKEEEQQAKSEAVSLYKIIISIITTMFSPTFIASL